MFNDGKIFINVKNHRRSGSQTRCSLYFMLVILAQAAKTRFSLSNQCFLSVQTFKTESALRLQALTQGPLSHDIITLSSGPPLTSSFE